MKTRLFLFVFVFAGQFASSQINKDSLLAIYHNTKLHDTVRLNAIGNIAWDFLSVSADSSLLYGKKQYLFAKEKKLQKWEAQALNIMSNAHSIKGDYGNALKQAFEALKIKEENGLEKSIAGSLNNIGTIYVQIKEYRKGLEYFSKALKLFEEQGNEYMIAIAYGNIGNCYASLKDSKQALIYYNESLNYFEKLGDKSYYSITLCNIAHEEKNLGKIESAKTKYEKALTISIEVGNKSTEILSTAGLAELYAAENKYDLAIELAIKALKLAEEYGDINILQSLHKGLYEDYKQLNKTKEALFHYEKSNALLDSIHKIDNQKEFLRAEIQFEYDKKTALARAEQIKKDAIATEKHEQQQLIVGFLIAGFLIVTIFTFMLVRRNKIVLKQKSTIEQQKNLIEEHQREMLDSITYAKRIQEAILPPVKLIENKLPGSFVLYKPKAIVAGDFYWMEEIGDTTLIAVADCTGHGVPGAMVSVVCSNALNRAVNEFKLIDSGMILDKTSDLVIETFKKSAENVKDGMDISLLALNKKNNTIQWSGANIDLWYFLDNEFHEIKADKQHIGVNDNRKPFSSHAIEYKLGMRFYLFTDGYADQFGGPKGKKLREKQLFEIISSCVNKEPKQQLTLLNSSFETWKGALEQVDDVCIVSILT